jgi:uncharacterized membrane protein
LKATRRGICLLPASAGGRDLGKGDPMGVCGLILSALGALIVAWGQSDIIRSVHLWLTALELEKDSKNTRRDIYNVVADKRMKRSVKLNQWLAPVGWAIFIAGILLQTVSYFRQYDLAALGFS